MSSGFDSGRCIILSQEHRRITFGRGYEEKGFVMIKDETMSTIHFRINIKPYSSSRAEERELKMTLIDLDSMNGTFVNGKKINKIILKNGDRIQAGGSQFEIFKIDKNDVLAQQSG